MKTKQEKNPYILSLKESRAILKSNIAEMKKYEKLKRKKVTPDYFTTELKDENNILEVENLHTYFYTDSGVSKAVNGITFSVPKNSIVGLVGESGCGKSVTSLSIMQLVQAPQGQVTDGAIRFATRDFILDNKGKRIPIYVKDEEGNVVSYDEISDSNWRYPFASAQQHSSDSRSIDSLGVMRDFGDKNHDVVTAWNYARSTGDTGSTLALLGWTALAVAVAVGAVALAIWLKRVFRHKVRLRDGTKD